jgi:succinate dehydrogenase / fumarate reductase flavoprotein subunit
VDAAMATDVPGLFAAGEAVGGANGANRLSGNAITEAITFGVVAGRSAASEPAFEGAPDMAELILLAEPIVAPLRRAATDRAVPVAELIVALQDVMQNDVGPFRNEAGLHRAASDIAALRERLGTELPGGIGPQDPVRVDGLDLRNMLMVAEAVVIAATARTESRGAHQRDDHPGMLDTWTVNQTLAWRDGQWTLAIEPVERLPASSLPDLALSDSSLPDPSLPSSEEARA